MKATSTLFNTLLTWIALGCVLLFNSCTPINIFEKNVPIPNMQWSSSFNGKGSFIIADTLATYNVYLTLRHTDKYAYNNIWLNIGLQEPGDSMQIQKINLSLGSDATGWEGTGMNDIWEVRKLLSANPLHFKNKGSYQFCISQIMRDNPLLQVMSVGLRLEKKL